MSVNKSLVSLFARVIVLSFVWLSRTLSGGEAVLQAAGFTDSTAAPVPHFKLIENSRVGPQGLSHTLWSLRTHMLL